MTERAGSSSRAEHPASRTSVERPAIRDDPDAAAAWVAEWLAERGIQTVRVEVPDVDGVLRGKRFGAERFVGAVRAGHIPWSQAVFCWDVAGHIYGNLGREEWQNGFFGDMMTVPDLATLACVPWEPSTAAALVDSEDASGREVQVAPRDTLRRLESELADRGYEVRAALEFEFVLLKETPETAAAKRYVGLEPADPGTLAYSLLRTTELMPVLEDIRELCSAAGITVDVLHTEPGPGMVEGNLRHLPLLRAADAAIRFKLAVKQIARRHGLLATFMAQWANEHSGCGAHIHQSLWSIDGKPASSTKRGRFAPRFKNYVAGQVETMPDLCVLFNPTVNGFRRVASTPAAPRNASWGVQNRLAAIRAIPGGAGTARIEHRRSGADCNPYLALAGCVAGGLHGLDTEATLPPAVEGNAYEAGADEAPALPGNLREATARFHGSSVARRYLGDAFVDHYAATREWEADEFDRAVTDWEVRRYLEQI